MGELGNKSQSEDDSDPDQSRRIRLEIVGAAAPVKAAVVRPAAAAADVEVLLPLAAVGFGLTAIGIVFQLTYAGVV
jgi:hypothetical protein